MKRYLLFSIDTEPDDPLWRGLHRGAWTHENLRGLPRLAALCRRMGVKPTFYVSHSTALHPGAAEALLPLLRDGHAEVGMHLHPGDTPPLGAWDKDAGDNVLKVPEALLEAKFDALHWEIWSRFGRPSSYRSAAWALDSRVVRLLEKHGYAADSSVTPGVSWRLHGRPSYLEAPNGAYRLGYGDPAIPGDSAVVEVPVSVWSPRRLDAGTMQGRFLGDLFTMPLGSRKGPVVRVVEAVRPPPPQWMRPAFKTLEEMKATARSLEGEGFLHVMVHSNEMWPGASPYVKTEADLDEFYRRLEGLFAFSLARGDTPATVTEYAHAAVASGAVPPPRSGIAAPDPGRQGPFGKAVGWSAAEALDGAATASASASASASRASALAATAGAAPPPPPPSRRRWAAVMAGKVAVSAGALALAFSQLDLGEIRRHLGQMEWAWVLACLAVVVAEITINAGKLSALCLPARLRVASLLRINFIKVLFNNILPGGVGGEAVRMYLIGRGIGSFGASAAAVTADRLTGLWTQALFTAVSLPFLTASVFSPGSRWLIAAGAAALAALVGFLIMGPGPRAAGKLMARLPGFRDRHLQEVVRFQAFWRELAENKTRLLVVAACSLVSQCLLIGILLTAVRSLGGSLDIHQTAPILLFSALAGLIPLSLGGLGVAEGAMALAFAAAGAPAEIGLLSSLVLRMTQAPMALLGGAFLIKGGLYPAGNPQSRRSAST